MIFLCLEEGFGNQLFECAYARALQKYYREPAIFVTLAHYDQRRPVFHELKYVLKELNLPEDFRFLDGFEGKRLWAHIKGLEYFYRAVYYPMRGNKLEVANRIMRHGFYFDIAGSWRYVPLVSSQNKNKYLVGRWQSEKFFYPVRSEIRKEFTVRTKPSSANALFLNRIDSCENPVCLHIRLGDYRTNPGLLVCGEEYYQNAVRYMLEHLNNPRFFVFSNSAGEVEWVRQNFRFDPRARMEYITQGNSVVEDYRLMYHCRHFILSNSSLSWWAQYMSCGGRGIVAAPSRWNNIGIFDRDIYQKDWVLLDV